MFTPEDLSAMAAADAEIEADFCLTQEEIEQSRARDRRAAFEALPFEKKVAAQQKAWYEANRRKNFTGISGERLSDAITAWKRGEFSEGKDFWHG